MASHSDKLVVALYGDSLIRAQEMVELLRPEVRHFEVGMELFTACGPAIIDMIRDADCRCFLDLKYHDIPSTVAKAVASATRQGVSCMTIHAAGGQRMMEEALESVHKTAGSGDVPKLIAVTVLTSMESLGDIGVQFEVRDQVLRLATLAQKVGLDGAMTSSLEIQPIRQRCGPDFCIVTSGIRLTGERSYDQRRISGPRQAIDAGADYLIIGRPITEARDPQKEVEAILQDMA
jgi:orotidine-5'-phosphate decarboxylase